MDDGNKESAKELMSTFRLVVGVGVSISVLFVNLQIRDLLIVRNTWLFWAGIALTIVSILACAYMFFVVVAMLSSEKPNIVNQPPVLTSGAVGLLTITSGIVLILASQL